MAIKKPTITTPKQQIGSLSDGSAAFVGGVTVKASSSAGKQAKADISSGNYLGGSNPSYKPTVASAPATSAIAADNLGATQALKMPQPSTDTSSATSLVAGANQSTKGIQDYLKEITPPETQTSKQYGDLMSQINTLLPDMANKAKDQLDTENKLKIPKLKQDLAALNSQILSSVAGYEKAIANEGVAPGEVPLNVVVGKQAVIRRNQAADIGLLQARALGLQGQVEMAQEMANRAIDLKYETLKDTVNVKMQQLQLLQPILNKEEQRYATALEMKYRDEREALAEKKALAKTNIALVLEAGLTTRFVNKNGEFFRTSDGMSFSTPEEFYSAAGVSSFEEAYSRGLIGDYSPDMAIGRSIVAEMVSKYPDAGITLRDTLETAQAKLNDSRIYQDNVRPPARSGGGGSRGGSPGSSSGGGVSGNNNVVSATELNNYIRKIISDNGGVNDENRYKLWEAVANELEDYGGASQYDDILWKFFHPESTEGYSKYVLGQTSSSNLLEP